MGAMMRPKTLFERMAAVARKADPEPKGPTIAKRIDATVERMRGKGEEPRAVYLTATDMRLFELERGTGIGGVSEWRETPVRLTKGKAQSLIYSKRCIGSYLLKRISQ
jgi:hypothetical protein